MDERTVVIESLVEDVHALAVAWGLRELGVKCEILYMQNLPTHASVAIDMRDPADPQLIYKGPGVDLKLRKTDRLVYWARRVMAVASPMDLAEADRAYARNENKATLDAWRHLLSGFDGAVFVNGNLAKITSNMKPVQLAVASSVGFQLPPTLFSNDIEDIAIFVDDVGGQVIFKSHTPLIWQERTEAGVRSHMAYSALVDKETIVASNSAHLCAGIYQAPVPKDYEVRITMLGSSPFACKIHSQENAASMVDWRAQQRYLRYEEIDVPEQVVAQCIEFMAAMGQVFGCFDFIVTPQGEWVFLECNEQGQWLWQEHRCPSLRLLDAFIQFLQAPSLDFRYMPGERIFTFREYRKTRWQEDDANARRDNSPTAQNYIPFESAM